MDIDYKYINSYITPQIPAVVPIRQIVFKAFIKNSQNGNVKKFIYNPPKFSDTVTTKYSEVGSIGGSYLYYQYAGGGNRTTSIELFLRNTRFETIDSLKNFIEDFLPDRRLRFHPPPYMILSYGKYIKKFLVTTIARDWSDFYYELTCREMTISLTLLEVP